jgi:Zn-dependent M28 family amino/carboxypeptidase
MLGAAACGASRFAVDGARAHARVVLQVQAGPRIPGSPGHARVRQWLARELGRLGAVVELQEVADSTLGRTVRLTNVIAHFGAKAGERGPILLCAHYDTRPWCDEDPDPGHRGDPLPGANDGASGVAVLLEVAELVSRRPAPVPVDLVFFDGEDQGRASQPEEFSLGARAYARLLKDPRPVAGFLFDMVGDKDLAVYAEAHSAERAANVTEVVFEAARATGARGFHPETRHRVVDDHLPLLEAGVPAVDIIDFDYPAWHTRRDLPSQVSAESLAEVARVAAWLVYSSPLARLR